MTTEIDIKEITSTLQSVRNISERNDYHRRDYIQISSDATQIPSSTGAVKITLNTVDKSIGITHEDGSIKINTPGLYFIMVAPQIGRGIGGKNKDEAGYIDIWLQRNNEMVPNSTVRATLRTQESKDVIVNQRLLVLNEGDKVDIMMRVEKQDMGFGIEAVNENENEKIPAVPSIIVSMYMIMQHDELLEQDYKPIS